MVVTLTNGGVTFTFSEGECESVRSGLAANLDSDSMPGSGPLDAMLFDYNGTLKTITISGFLFNDGTNHLDSGTATTINGQRQWLEKILNGSQTVTTIDSNYTSSWNGSAWVVSTCLKSAIEFDERTGDPNRLAFTINLIVGGV